MKKWLIFLFFISLNFLSCHPPEVVGPEGDYEGHFALIGPEDVKVANLDVDIIEVDMNVFLLDRGPDKHSVHLICRSMDGCLRVCEHLNKKHCRKKSINQVVKLWGQEVDSYQQWDQALADLSLIATEPAVSAFLKNADKKNKVLEKLFQKSQYANCPQFQDPTKEIMISASHTSPSASLLFLALSDSKAPASSCAPTTEKAEKADDDDVADATKAQAGSTEEAKPAEKADDTDATDATDADATQAQADSTEEAKPAEKADADAADATQAQAGSTEEAESPAEATEEQQMAETAEQQCVEEPELKKIVDGTQTPFNSVLFHGFIKQCFGHQTRTFSEMSAQIENKDAFSLGYKLISKACGKNANCIRLAYCAINNEQIWNYLPEEMQKAGCEYSSFSEVM